MKHLWTPSLTVVIFPHKFLHFIVSQRAVGFTAVIITESKVPPMRITILIQVPLRYVPFTISFCWPSTLLLSTASTWG